MSDVSLSVSEVRAWSGDTPLPRVVGEGGTVVYVTRWSIQVCGGDVSFYAAGKREKKDGTPSYVRESARITADDMPVEIRRDLLARLAALIGSARSGLDIAAQRVDDLRDGAA